MQQAFIRLHHGETHHLQRAVVPKRASIVAYGALDAEERAIFEALVARNALNMNFEHYRIHFVEESAVEAAVRKILQTWKES